MSDTISPERRSRNMAAIRCKDTKPEIYIRKCLFALGYRYRKNDSRILGHPDIYLPKYRTAVFVNGCYWHRHKGCKYAYTPKSNVDFWMKKFQNNIERDNAVKAGLLEQRIKCLVIWECTVKEMQKSEAKKADVMERITTFLASDETYREL